MCTPDILADRFPSSTYDTPASTRHMIIARDELRDRGENYLIVSPTEVGNCVIADTTFTFPTIPMLRVLHVVRRLIPMAPSP
jgi:hypothetical protein